MIHALYVDPVNGPYARLLGAERCWGVERDAKRYDGPGAVVAHPPCKTWGRLAWRVSDADHKAAHPCGPRAVEQVRRHGGVLEHPQGSKGADGLHRQRRPRAGPNRLGLHGLRRPDRR